VAPRPLPELENDIALGIMTLDEAVVALADAERAEDLAALLARRLGIVHEGARRILASAAEQPAALLCRAAGLSLNGYSAVLRLRRRGRRGPAPNPTVLLSAYHSLKRLGADELVDMLDLPTVEAETST
jgi:hypothetical protein